MRGRPKGPVEVGAALADDASRLTPNLTARLAAVAPLVDAAILAASRRSSTSPRLRLGVGELDRLLPFARARPTRLGSRRQHRVGSEPERMSVAGTAPSSVVPRPPRRRCRTASAILAHVSEGGLPATAPSRAGAHCPPAARRRRLAAGRLLAAGAPRERSVVPIIAAFRGCARGRGARGRRARGGGGAPRRRRRRSARARRRRRVRRARARRVREERGVGGATEAEARWRDEEKAREGGQSRRARERAARCVALPARSTPPAPSLHACPTSLLIPGKDAGGTAAPLRHFHAAHPTSHTPPLSLPPASQVQLAAEKERRGASPSSA